MKRTISIRLEMTHEESQKFLALRDAFFDACNQIVPFVVEHRCWNRVALHHLVYTKIRGSSPLGSQMVCNAIFSVCKAYNNRTILREETVPIIHFHKNRSVHFDKRTYSIKGSQSAKQLLKKISGKEARRVKQINHEVSKQVIKEAIRQEAGIIVLEDLTHIRKRIRAGKKIRSRLHRWSFFQFQTMVRYKAEHLGISVIHVNPAYSSQLCSLCGSLGVRERHHFKCSCGNQQHSDLNASRNLCRFAESIGPATCAVNRT